MTGFLASKRHAVLLQIFAVGALQSVPVPHADRRRVRLRLTPLRRRPAGLAGQFPV